MLFAVQKGDALDSFMPGGVARMALLLPMDV
jgi:hypothetical protein